MSIDLSQFHQVFFEESVEGLDIMESALMELDPTDVDDETINAIFRCAHSIKGGSATFSFNAICDFTHVLETLLDQVRSGQRSLVLTHVNLLLESVDCLREMLALAQSGELEKTEQAATLQRQFEAILANEGPAPAQKTEAAPTVNSDADAPWLITFQPSLEIMQTGNDPARILRELRNTGALQLVANSDALPEWGGFDPEQCYLSWRASVPASIEKNALEEVFEWVTDLADISITRSGDCQPLAIDQHENNHCWKIHFVPSIDVMRTGNDPLRILAELKNLSSTYHSKADTKGLPDFADFEPESCYLGWDIKLEANTEVTEIETAFEWVADESQLTISALVAAPREDGQTEAEAVNSNEAKLTPILAPVSVVEQKEPVKASKAKPANKASTDATFIRVGIDKIDNLINMVGELVITQSMLGQLSEDVDVAKVPRLVEGLNQLEQNTRELQEGVMRIRMLPISFSFNRFPRLVRDLSQRLEKQVELVIHGENTELDKTVMEKIGDPLVHLVRNAVDHGIELPAARLAAGKPEVGTITLDAYHKGGNIVIEIKDDGAGLNRDKVLQKAIDKKIISASDAAMMTDEQVYDLIFQPGFSTAAAVTDVSGRGVGMDVVKRNIQALNGAVDIASKLGEGSTITIRLPLTLAILDGQLIRVGGNIYIFPLISIVESMQCRSEYVNQLAGGQQVFRLRDEYVPIIELSKTFSIPSDTDSIEGALMVVVEFDGQKVGVIVDELLGQQQVVIKSLEQNYKQVEGVSGATILGDGTVALILDVQSIVDLFSQKLVVAQNTSTRVDGYQVMRSTKTLN
ncbi:chemotaxis protein CheA [Saccharophagus degradans]|uniref:Chemotaxis protein CheA n=1 Tax=Saccharophagus degradans (strain 2-40 / ATCC 43961 / DSM 17024) TaxID=203122 RepID=Q21G15_SACD2|nr:chemotaxis protein CheA [Saccharophagus degradans]ABD82364.1 ATP-binding region, ATPase-like protein [Saccharophagus degradans 2-40]